jgi:hypothetical protein
MDGKPTPDEIGGNTTGVLPDLRVVFPSGYGMDVKDKEFILRHRQRFLWKSYAISRWDWA